jgi:hypothetical protein
VGLSSNIFKATKITGQISKKENIEIKKSKTAYAVVFFFFFFFFFLLP